MNELWTAKQDYQLAELRDAGLSFGKIAAQMKVTRNAAIARYYRIIGIKFPCYVAMRKKEREETAARVKIRNQKAREAIAAMKAKLRAGATRNNAVKEAWKAGAGMKSIGAHLGVTRQRVSQICAQL